MISDLDKLLLTAVSFLRSEENVIPANFVTPEGVWENVFTHKNMGEWLMLLPFVVDV